MKHADALSIAEALVDFLEQDCERHPQREDEPMIVIAGGLRRGKPDVHDIEIVAQPVLKAPPLVFGEKPYATFFDKTLANLQENGFLGRAVKSGPKLKQYAVNLTQFGLRRQGVGALCVEFYLATPPAQFGVDLLIRTGPGEKGNNFSQWIVTSRSKGGALPDGYKVKHAAVWRVEQLNEKNDPIRGEQPLSMPDEMDFIQFLEMEYIEPGQRIARWKR